jgi:hypothetical protein
MNWLVLTYSLPAGANSSPRVTLWRRLKRLGAVAATGAYILPARDECRESFQWLAQEIRQTQGEALVLHITQIEGLSDAEIVALFHEARRSEYTELEEQLSSLEQQVAAGAGTATVPREALERLRRRYAEIARVDYFESPAGRELAGRLERLVRLLNPLHPGAVPPATVAAYQGRRWVTRPRPHVDRLACIWFIRRFIDPAAQIHYADSARPDEVAFDIEGATFGHQGERCSFETMLTAFGLDEPGLQALAEIVHALDLWDGPPERPEAAGVDAILRGWLQAGLADADLEQHGVTLFEGLYLTLRQQATTAVGSATRP